MFASSLVLGVSLFFRAWPGFQARAEGFGVFVAGSQFFRATWKVFMSKIWFEMPCSRQPETLTEYLCVLRLELILRTSWGLKLSVFKHI